MDPDDNIVLSEVLTGCGIAHTLSFSPSMAKPKIETRNLGLAF